MAIILDLTSFDYFCKVVESLENGIEPTEEEWEELFSSPGYKSLIDREYNKDFFITSFSIVFNPNKREELEKVRTSKVGRYIRHYEKIRREKDIIIESIKKIKENWKRLEESIENRALSLLPKIEEKEKVTVSIAVFDIDARSFDSIVIDACFTNTLEIFAEMTAHELHHFYRNKLLCFDRSKIDEQDKDLMWVINQLHSEGIADQIDKDFFIFSKISTPFPTEYVNQFKMAVEHARETIAKIDELFKQIVEEKEPESKAKLQKKLRSIIPLGGHPIGYYMAMIIIKENRVKPLIDNIGNPFSFFRLYNEAALADREDLPIFCGKSIQLLEELERKYCYA
ncbi:MAG: DUF5700 domain-containing putative Zn-dependent protease [Candidatus Heimdallarchaeaceae archaeon]